MVKNTSRLREEEAKEKFKSCDSKGGRGDTGRRIALSQILRMRRSREVGAASLNLLLCSLRENQSGAGNSERETTFLYDEEDALLV